MPRPWMWPDRPSHVVSGASSMPTSVGPQSLRSTPRLVPGFGEFGADGSVYMLGDVACDGDREPMPEP